LLDLASRIVHTVGPETYSPFEIGRARLKQLPPQLPGNFHDAWRTDFPARFGSRDRDRFRMDI